MKCLNQTYFEDQWFKDVSILEAKKKGCPTRKKQKHTVDAFSAKQQMCRGTNTSIHRFAFVKQTSCRACRLSTRRITDMRSKMMHNFTRKARNNEAKGLGEDREI